MLGQWMPRFPVDPGRTQPHDPISTELARRIQRLNDELGQASNECARAYQRYDHLEASRVGLAPALFDDPRNLADPELEAAYLKAYRICNRADALAGELNRLRQMLRARAARRMTMSRVAPILRSAAIPFYGY